MKEKEQEVTQDGDLKVLLQLMLESKADEIKEKKAKEQKAHDERVANIQAQIESARAENERNKLRRDLCDGMGGPPHQTLNPANMNVRSAWRGQVNSDGTFSPVCCKCQLVMPKIRATDEQKKEGVNLNGYVQLSVKALENWHIQSYPVANGDGGCDFYMCYLCHPKKFSTSKPCTNDVCHFCHPEIYAEQQAVAV